MARGDFVWCDLSARNMDAACAFYNQLFGWCYHIDAAADGSEYRVVHAANPMVGIYTMPHKFIDMGMPCFWMSYMEVTSVTASIETANAYGAKVEVGPISGPHGSTIALIRDPLGAGFTIIEGDGFSSRTKDPGHGDMAWNELFVSDADAVAPFYQAMFGWDLVPTDDDTNSFSVITNGEHRSTINQMPEDIRGREQFWGVHFDVDDLTVARSVLLSSGSIIYERDGLILARDTDDAAFFVTQYKT